tara:strand:- start:1115 stop:2386 length:1272 start_codon:yes stop_codon:yes gene_type:complete
MSTLPKYPYTVGQKMDVALFASKEEKDKIAQLNKLNQKLHDLNRRDYPRPYGVPSPQGFLERVQIALGTQTGNRSFEQEFESVNKHITHIEQKRELERLKKDPVKYQEHLLAELIKANPPNEKHVTALQKIWVDQIIKETTIKKGTVLYSGQTSRKDMVFNQMSNHNDRGQGMWLTQSIDDAVTYAYKAGAGKKGRQIFAFVVEKDFNVVELDAGYHPGLLDAHADRNNLPLASHETITYGFDEIVDPIAKSGIVSPNVIGHLRYNVNNMNEISELWVKKPDPKLLRASNTFILPLDHSVFQKTFPRNTFSKVGEQKSLEILQSFSAHNTEAWAALSFKAGKLDLNQTVGLQSLIDECGFTELSDHIKTIIEHSDNEAMITLLHEHEHEHEGQGMSPPRQKQNTFHPTPTPNETPECRPRVKR